MSVPENVKANLEPEEWDYWYMGKPAAKELPDPFGTIEIPLVLQQVRHGGGLEALGHSEIRLEHGVLRQTVGVDHLLGFRPSVGEGAVELESADLLAGDSSGRVRRRLEQLV